MRELGEKRGVSAETFVTGDQDRDHRERRAWTCGQ